MDVLQEHLVRARASGGVFARSIAVAPWGLRLPGTIQLAVHAMIQGHACLWADGDDHSLELKPGDLALVRGGPDHFIAHERGARCFLPEDFRAHHSAAEAERDPRAAVFLCGAYRFAGDIGAGLVGALPPVLSIPSRMDNPIHGVVALLSRELAQVEPGRQTVLDRLLERPGGAGASNRSRLQCQRSRLVSSCLGFALIARFAGDPWRPRQTVDRRGTGEAQQHVSCNLRARVPRGAG